MRRSRWIFLLLVFILACTSQEKKAREEPLLAAETFNWCIIPLTFQPPPAQWARQKHNQGGLRGVWFTHKGSVGERIYVAEYYKVGERAMLPGHKWDFSLDDVVEDTRFSTEGWPIHPDSFVIQPMVPDTVAGYPAYRLDFTLNTTEQRSLVGREYYFIKRDHLFEAAYLGLPVNLPLFERVIDSMTFDPQEGP